MFYKKGINLFIFFIISCNTSFAKETHDNYIDFDVEGARHTYAKSISKNGMVAGSYVPIDGEYTYQGFIRMTNGDITKFSVPGANVTDPVSINNAGTITGIARSNTAICDVLDDCESFVRTLDGKITRFTVPGAKGGTIAVAINNAGTITGYAKNTHSRDGYDTQGFVRQTDGTIITFDVPGAKYTRPTSINQDGIITGCYDIDSSTSSCSLKGYANDRGRGFVRKADGTFITFDASGSVLTYPTAINDKGEITGVYSDSNYNNDPAGFVRSTDGIISTFSVLDRQQTWYVGTHPVSINNEGVILGSFHTSRPYLTAGFTRGPNGEIKEWKHPKAKEDDTSFNDVNASGIAVGDYSDFGYARIHAFIIDTKK